MNIKRRATLGVILILLLFVLIQLRQDKFPFSLPEGSFVDGIFVSVVTPVQEVIDLFSDYIGDTWSAYFSLVGVKRENKKLKEELALKNLYLLSLKERLKLKERTEYLKQKVHLLGWEGVTARVIGYDPYARSQTLWISVGSSQGVQIDQPVITLEGLVGRIVKVFKNDSQVLLLVDSRFSVDVIDEATRVRALVVGSDRQAELKRYPYLTHLEFLKLGDAVNEGDLLITSGFSDLYPPSIPVGNVIKIAKKEDELFQTSVVLPLVDFSTLEQVIVITGEIQKEE